MELQSAVEVITSGLAAGSIYVLLAVGFNITFATSRILNFAHGEFFMLGTAVGYLTYAHLGWPLSVAVLATLAIAVLGGAVEEFLAIRPALRHGFGASGWLVATLGFAIIVRSSFSLVMGSDPLVFPAFLPTKPFEVAGLLFQPQQIAMTGFTLVLSGVIAWLYRRTILGRVFGAISQDRDAALLRGLPAGLLSTGSLAIASGLAALAGLMAAPITGAYPTLGLLFTLKGFVAAAVGGIPQIRGAIVGGFGLGLLEAIGVDRVGTGYRNAVVFAALLLILAFRPGGLFPSRNSRPV